MIFKQLVGHVIGNLLRWFELLTSVLCTYHLVQTTLYIIQQKPYVNKAFAAHLNKCDIVVVC